MIKAYYIEQHSMEYGFFPSYAPLDPSPTLS